MSTKALLEKNPQPNQEDIEYALDGNICRCAGYPKIFDAVRKAGEQMKNENEMPTPVSQPDESRSKLKEINKGITYADFVKTAKQ